MATNRSIQLMLHAVYIDSAVPPPPSAASLPPSGFNLNLTKPCLCFPKDTRLLSNVQAIKLMDAGGKSPLRGHLHKPRGKMYLQNRATLCFSDLTCLRAPCFKARHKSVKRFPWVTILSGSSHHEDNICGETRPRSTHWAATETRERFSHTPGKLLWVVVAGERFSQADRLLGWGWGCHQH